MTPSDKELADLPSADSYALVAADAKPEGDLSIVTRDDGAKQWAYKGKPIYTYAADKKAGDMTGDNFKDVWHIIK